MRRFEIVTEMVGGSTVVKELESLGGDPCSADEELAALEAYFEAHDSVPWRPLQPEEVEGKAKVLRNALSSDEAIIEALLHLAHTALPEAREALRAYDAAPHAGFELMAMLALDECEFWALHGGPILPFRTAA